jgi:hypothetical protein
MGIITAILSVLGSIFGVIGSMVAWAVKTIPWYVWIVLIVGCVIFHYGYKAGGSGKGMGCSCREFMCSRTPRDPRLVTVGPYKVVSVDGPTSITVAAGLRGKQTQLVRLQFIETTSGGDASIATDHLRGMAGDSITVQIEKHGIFRDDAQDGQRRLDEESSEETTEVPALVEARQPIVGVAFGFSGINLNLAMIEVGYVTCSPDAPAHFKAAEKAANKKRK